MILSDKEWGDWANVLTYIASQHKNDLAKCEVTWLKNLAGILKRINEPMEVVITHRQVIDEQDEAVRAACIAELEMIIRRKYNPDV